MIRTQYFEIRFEHKPALARSVDGVVSVQKFLNDAEYVWDDTPLGASFIMTPISEADAQANYLQGTIEWGDNGISNHTD